MVLSEWKYRFPLTVEDSDALMKLWDAYREIYFYANDIEFTDTVEAIKWIYRNI